MGGVPPSASEPIPAERSPAQQEFDSKLQQQLESAKDVGNCEKLPLCNDAVKAKLKSGNILVGTGRPVEAYTASKLFSAFSIPGITFAALKIRGAIDGTDILTPLADSISAAPTPTSQNPRNQQAWLEKKMQKAASLDQQQTQNVAIISGGQLKENNYCSASQRSALSRIINERSMSFLDEPIRYKEYGKRKEGMQDLLVLNPSNMVELVDLLIANGKPISNLLLATHGIEGTIFLAPPSGEWIEDHIGDQKFIEQLLRLKEHNLLAPDAQIMFGGCRIASTEAGREALQKLADKLGVKIIAATETNESDTPASNNILAFYPEAPPETPPLAQATASAESKKPDVAQGTSTINPDDKKLLDSVLDPNPMQISYGDGELMPELEKALDVYFNTKKSIEIYNKAHRDITTYKKIVDALNASPAFMQAMKAGLWATAASIYYKIFTQIVPEFK